MFNVSTNSDDFDQLVITNDGELGSLLEYEVQSASYPVNTDQVDSFGYAWIKSNDENNIIEYDWIDISNDYTVLHLSAILHVTSV